MAEETEKTQNLIELLDERVAFVDPTDGMLIDSESWRWAHGQHTRHRKLHALTAHRPGIVAGLEVLPAAGPGNENKVFIAPGVAVDGYGRTVIQPIPELKEIQQGSTQYILLNFAVGEHPTHTITVQGQVKPENRLKLEERKLVPTFEAPEAHQIELARIKLIGNRIEETSHPSIIDDDCINLLYRTVAFPNCYADVAVKEIAFLSAKDGKNRDSRTNRPGLWNLVHEGNSSGFHLSFYPPNSSNDPLRGTLPALLYMAGADGINQRQEGGGLNVGEIRQALSQGSLLFAEACRGGQAFADDFKRFASAELGANLQPLPADAARLLKAHYLFPSVPTGGQTRGELLADFKCGVIFSSYDYGAAWQGNVPAGQPNPREAVRQSIEFGLNIIAFATLRQRRHALANMGKDSARPLLF